jgi:hypothetical protein
MRFSTAGAVRGRPSVVPLSLARGKPSVDPFADDAPSKFSEDTQHLKHGAAGGGRSVQALLMQKQIDALIAKRLQDGQQIGQRAP